MTINGLPAIEPGQVWLVGAGPGDPGLLTCLAYHALLQADTILHDALVPAAILDLAPAAAERVPVGKRCGRPSFRQMHIHELLIAEARAGRRVLRLKGGDPFLFGRGSEEALALAAAGVPFRIVPGVSAGLAAPALAGIPVTHRNLSRSVAFVTGHGIGGGSPELLDLESLAKGAETLVLFMAASRLDALRDRLLAAGRAPDEPVAIVLAAGTPQACRILTSLGECVESAADRPPDLPALIVVGRVVDLSLALAPDFPGLSPVVAATRLAS